MGTWGESITVRRPSYVVGADGEPTAVLVDIAAWQAPIRRLEDMEDTEILREMAGDLAMLAEGRRPAGWKSWEEFEAELDAMEDVGEIPDTRLRFLRPLRRKSGNCPAMSARGYVRRFAPCGEPETSWKQGPEFCFAGR